MSQESSDLSPLGKYLKAMQSNYEIDTDRLLARWLDVSGSTLSRWLYGGRGISRSSRIKIGVTQARFMLSSGEIQPDEFSSKIREIANELLDLQRSRRPLKPFRACVDEHLAHLAGIEVEIAEAISSEKRDQKMQEDVNRLTH